MTTGVKPPKRSKLGCSGVNLQCATAAEMKRGIKCRCCLNAQRLIAARDDRGLNSKGKERDSADFSNLAGGRVPEASMETSMICQGCGILLCSVCATVDGFVHPKAGKMKTGLPSEYINQFKDWLGFKASRPGGDTSHAGTQ